MREHASTYTVERKRQNVLGEGFEDLLQLLLIEVGQVPESQIVIRRRANKLPGFQTSSKRDRIEAPDIALVREDQTALLASVKWSLRHDRQKQLSDELDCYAELLSQEIFPRYVLVTNEYDPSRLVNADGLARRGLAIDCIYHTNLDVLLRVLENHARVKDLKPLIASGRLRSIADFLEEFRRPLATL
ncbi:MAG TPA: NgoMIV family type II restriction endonuclease [Anaerolineae bacterium]|nr:NgoMIV family type II restriction endonuclease [Anaerolineae bacterium]